MWSEFWRKDAAGSSKLGFHPSQWTSHPTCHLFPKIGTNETSPRNKVFRLGSNFPRSWRRGCRCITVKQDVASINTMFAANTDKDKDKDKDKDNDKYRSWRRGWRCSRMWLPLTPCLPLTLRKPPPSTLPQLLPLFFWKKFCHF